MAITANTIATDLVLVMDNGTGASGQQLSKNRAFTKVKPDAANADLFAVAQDLLSLQDKTGLSVQRRDIVEIKNQ
ncbi:DUF1659 domain-containing protein [Syntrophomonas curvata]